MGAENPEIVAKIIEGIPLLDPAALEQLRELASADPAVVQELIDLFFKGTPERLALIEAAIEKSDAEGVRAQAHSMKSSSATLGAARLSRIFKALEASAGGDGAELRELARGARSEFEAACRGLREQFPSAAGR